MQPPGVGVELRVRRARADEHDAVATLWLRARAAAYPAIPPPAHSETEVRTWFRDHVLPDEEVWVVAAPEGLVAMMALRGEELAQLYVAPRWTGRGLGAELLGRAMRDRASLTLWAFQANGGARRFYERHGFQAVAMTDGENEEGEPDVRYEWRRGGA
ncbi:MAG TPA: GNAT family N-acetyltransferase [Solirubrobacteraceae bacterium]|nr:GNAT family N-acetyltransferase [Solirubrobacteraceae bacterium]